MTDAQVSRRCRKCETYMVKQGFWETAVCHKCGWVWRGGEERCHIFIAIFAGFIAGLFILICSTFAADRCVDYATDVRQASVAQFGLSYPWWYNLGQLRQESGCRADVTAFDGGQGLAQFMPATERDIERSLGPLNMYNPEHAIRAQAFYLKRLHSSNPSGRLAFTFMSYNSGPGTVKKEAMRAGSWDYDAMRAVCSRKVLTLKNGGKLDLCDVGYDYPKQIYKYGSLYRAGADQWRFW